MSDMEDPLVQAYDNAQQGTINRASQSAYLVLMWKQWQEQRLHRALDHPDSITPPQPPTALNVGDWVTTPDGWTGQIQQLDRGIAHVRPLTNLAPDNTPVTAYSITELQPTEPPDNYQHPAPTDADRQAFAPEPHNPDWTPDHQRRFDVTTAKPGAIIHHPQHGDGMILDTIDDNGNLTIAYLKDNPPGQLRNTPNDFTTHQTPVDDIYLVNNNGLTPQHIDHNTATARQLAQLHPNALERWEWAADKATADHALAGQNERNAETREGHTLTTKTNKHSDTQHDLAHADDHRRDRLAATDPPQAHPRVSKNQIIANKPDAGRIARNHRSTPTPKNPQLRPRTMQPRPKQPPKP